MHLRTLTYLILCCLLLPACNRDAGTRSERPTPDQPAVTTCSREPLEKDLLRIAVIPKGTSHVFWKTVEAGARKAAEELPGVEMQWQGPLKEDDREQQMNVVENFVNVGVDGIVLAPLDDRALLRPVRDARSAGIDVVIMDSGLQAEPCTEYASFVATDNYAGGVRAGHRLAEVLNGRGNVILLRYAVGSASNERREEGFLAAIAEYPRIKILSSDQRAGVTSEEAQNKAESLLQRFPEVEGVFCPNEPVTFGMLRALEEAGRAGEVKLVGFDTSEKLVAAMRVGAVHGLVLQDPLSIGYLSVKTLVAYLRGHPVDTRIDTGCVVATPENMDKDNVRRLLSPTIE